MTKVKFTLKGETDKKEGFIEDSENFVGGKKITYKISDNETGVVSIKLVKCYEE